MRAVAAATGRGAVVPNSAAGPAPKLVLVVRAAIFLRLKMLRARVGFWLMRDGCQYHFRVEFGNLNPKLRRIACVGWDCLALILVRR